MKWTIKSYWPEIVRDGTVIRPEKTEEFEIPFNSSDSVYYAYEKTHLFRKPEWVIEYCIVTGAWVSDEPGVILNFNRHVPKCRFDQIFTDRDEALDFCVRNNAHKKVKIYGE